VTDPDFPDLTEAKVVSVKPGDVIVLRTYSQISAAQTERIREVAQWVWPDNRVLVFCEVDLEVVREEPDGA
jgi:hypothetical protein